MRPGFGPAAELPTSSPARRRHGGCNSPLGSLNVIGGNHRAALASARGTGRTAYTKDVSRTEERVCAEANAKEPFRSRHCSTTCAQAPKAGAAEGGGMWRGLSVADQGVVWYFDQQLRAHEQVVAPLIDLSDGDTLLLFSDYSGEQPQSRFSCLTYFVTNDVEALKWDEWRIHVRAKFNLSDRRIGYSRLNDKRRAAAAPTFVHLANQLRGFVVCVLIDKRITSFFKPGVLNQAKKIGGESAEHWRPRAFERMARATQLAAFFAAGASSPGQRIIWITDEDELAPSVDRFAQVTSAFANALFRYAPHRLGPVRFGTTATDSGALELEDLAAIPDMFAGAITEIASADGEFGSTAPTGIPLAISERARTIGGALFDPDTTLRKIIFIARPIQGSGDFRLNEVGVYTENGASQTKPAG